MLLKFQIQRMDATIRPGDNPRILTEGRLFADTDILRGDPDQMMSRVMPVVEEWLCEHGEEVVAAFPGRRWCVHIEYNALIDMAVIDMAHDITKKEDMARWN